jgi:hypothetical protein
MQMSKSEFAAHIGVVPSRITKMIVDGLIGADALVGEGRFARIDVDLAKEQIAARRHVGQALANGIKTQLEGAAPSMSTEPDEAEATPAELIQLERLEQERRKNRQADRDEAIANGQLVPATDLQLQVRKVARDVVELFTGMAPDLANAISAKYGLPARDLQHLILEVMTTKRAAAAKQVEASAAELPETSETIVA